MHIYVMIWLGLTAALTREYLILNRVWDGTSALVWLNSHGFLLPPGAKVTTDPGDPWSFRLGGIGFGIICLTNLYLLRRKLPALANFGTVRGWLDFHIFCGMVGPTLIVFHTNFQVRGLVAISFWSMMISFLSGFVGRYFYTQLVSHREDMRQELRNFEKRFKRWEKEGLIPGGPAAFNKMKQKALVFVGVDAVVARDQATLGEVLYKSLIGDFKRLSGARFGTRGMPRKLAPELLAFAVQARRFYTARYFRRLMGYWHTFHKPFAIFMYVVTVIHIIAALVFRVRH